MYFAFCPGPEGPVLLVLAMILFAAFCATVFGLFVFMKLVNDWRKRRALWSSTGEDAGSILCI